MAQTTKNGGAPPEPEERETVALKLPPAPPMPDPPGEAEVLAKYGKTAGQMPRVLLNAADAVRVTAKKMVDESTAGLEAAREMLAMLEKEQEMFALEVTRAADTFALHVTDYLTKGYSCAQSMIKHRESIATFGANESEPETESRAR